MREAFPLQPEKSRNRYRLPEKVEKMSLLEVEFTVVEENACPLYEKGDVFRLSGNALFINSRTPMCMILASDIISICGSIEDARDDIPTKDRFNCGGCTGAVKVEYEKEKEYVFLDTDEKPEGSKDNIATMLSRFSFFKTLGTDQIKDLISFIRLKQYQKGEDIIRKGDPGRNLFIILSGMVEVLGESGINIAFLGKGEIFGEMSLLSGDPVGATIKAVESTRVIYMNSVDFRKVLNKYPPLQMYFARLLTQRLQKTNIVRAEDFQSGMSGTLAEMPPSELFQTFNMNQKTGVLNINLPNGRAAIYFNEGKLVHAKYGDLEDKEAFWEILKATEGHFKFTPGLPPEEKNSDEIGQFMWLLMEGLNRIDEKR
jgi:CRP/FNR family transcriptional regulator, cyclic AMP receptor protein